MKRSTHILILTIFFILIFSVFYFSKLINKPFNNIKDIDYSALLINKTGISVNEDYTVFDEMRIKKIIDDVSDIEKSYAKVKYNVYYKGKYDYELKLLDNHRPANYLYIIFMGNEYLELRLYNYESLRYDIYRTRIDLSDEGISCILFGD